MTPAYSGEIMLLRWSENHVSGATVTFLLSDPADLEAFRGMTVKRGGHAGTRLACVLVEIADDESLEGDLPLPPKSAADLVDDMEEREAKKRSGFPNGLTGLAINWARSEGFRAWLESEIGIPVADEQTARDLICSLCGIDSRKELNSNPDAAAIFDETIRLPYSKHLGENQSP